MKVFEKSRLHVKLPLQKKSHQFAEFQTRIAGLVGGRSPDKAKWPWQWMSLFLSKTMIHTRNFRLLRRKKEKLRWWWRMVQFNKTFRVNFHL